MIPLQADPHSPATQPYNQAPKAYNNGNNFGMGQQNQTMMPMQQQPMQQQPMQTMQQQTMQQQTMQQPAAGNNPFAGINAFSNDQPLQTMQQKQEKPAAEPHSPVPEYVAVQGGSAQTQAMGGAVAPTTPVIGYGYTPAPGMNQAQSLAAPVTPPSQFGAGGMVQNLAPVAQQQQAASNPFASSTTAENQSQPVTPTLQYNMPNGNMAEQQPASPPAFATSESSFASTPVANDQNVDFDFGPPMGSPVEGGPPLSELPTSTSLVPTNNGNQYEGIVNGMGALSVRPGQTPPEQQPYGNYSPGYPTQQPVYPDAGNPWGMEQQAPANSWNNGAQQQPAAYPSPSDWNPMVQQQQQQPAPYQGYGSAPQGYGTQLPGLDHSPQGHQSPYGAPPGQGFFSYDNAAVSAPTPSQYGPGAHQSRNMTSNISSPLEHKPRNPLDDHKSLTDLTREKTANIRALRLLEVAARDYGYNDADGDGYGYVGGYESHQCRTVGQALKLEKAKLQQAKQIRKMKKREFKTRDPREQLAESSRAAKKAPQGYDPELTSEKCLLDLDRQRASQKKALKLMGLF